MPFAGEINSEKIFIKDVFKMWFSIPEYQRPYVWEEEQIQELLDDLTYAHTERPESEYFLGSFVFQAKPAAPELGRKYPENDLLDGQQRMTTMLLLMAVIRDLSTDADVKSSCQEYIFQRAKKIEKIPERVRIQFNIRDEAQDFIDRYVKIEDGTTNEAALNSIIDKTADVTTKNMAKAIREMRKFFADTPAVCVDEFLSYMVNKVLMIYVSSEDMDDAFRLFTILNDRGIPLRNSDILKSLNLGALESDIDKHKYAKMWEEAEGELGDDFDRFLNHIRTILVKEKARLNLLQEFEDKIYAPKEKDKSTGVKKPVLLKKGKQTFELIETYLSHYKTLFSGQNYDDVGNFKFDNLIRVMLGSLPATDWVPPLLRYFEKFGYTRLHDFLIKLDNKFSADWIGQLTPTDRIEAMNAIIKVIDSAAKVDEVFAAPCFDFDKAGLVRVLNGHVYGRRFAKYIMLKLDYFFQNHDQKMHFDTLSVEHILPQNPDVASQWVKDFTPDQRADLTNRLGNLVLITRRKNSSQGRLDYADKMKKYFEKNIDTCPNSLRVLKKYSKWAPTDLDDNHTFILGKVKGHYGIT